MATLRSSLRRSPDNRSHFTGQFLFAGCRWARREAAATAQTDNWKYTGGEAVGGEGEVWLVCVYMCV